MLLTILCWLLGLYLAPMLLPVALAVLVAAVVWLQTIASPSEASACGDCTETGLI